jgi:SAM-dependent methyltransferase
VTEPVQFSLQDTARVRDYLEHSIADPSARPEFQSYIAEAFQRFLITMEFLPDRPGCVLEIGSTPYFLTLIMKRFRPYELELSNFFGQTTTDSSVFHNVEIDNPDYGEHHQLCYRQFNIEQQPFPYGNASLDGVVFCEVLEHLTADPMVALAEMHRVLKPGGWLLVTTPNAAWYQNIANLWLVRNAYGPYSAHGPYGRHNREYTLPELAVLLRELGFDVQRIEARDLHPGRKLAWRSRIIRTLKPARYHEEGLFCLAVKSRPLNLTRPEWLYSLGYKMPWPAYVCGKPAMVGE